MITRSNRGTLYQQVYDLLLERITSGEFQIGSQLPTEKELCEQFGVSRITIRSAMDKLEAKGLVQRDIGRGTFVDEPKINSPHIRLHSFSKEIEALGYVPGAKLLECKKIQANEKTAKQLGIKKGKEILFVSRLRTANNSPIFLGHSCLNIQEFPQLEKADYSCISLAQLFNSLLPDPISRIVQWISAQSVDKEISEYLGLDNGSRVLVMERIIHTTKNVPVESIVAYFHPDRYKNYTEVILS